jgi:hypothetical protein
MLGAFALGEPTNVGFSLHDFPRNDAINACTHIGATTQRM